MENERLQNKENNFELNETTTTKYLESPELRRGSSFQTDSPLRLVCSDYEIEVKNSTVCIEKGAKDFKELSALLKSKCLSPIDLNYSFSTDLSSFLPNTSSDSNKTEAENKKGLIIKNFETDVQYDFQSAFNFDINAKTKYNPPLEMNAVYETNEEEDEELDNTPKITHSIINEIAFQTNAKPMASENTLHVENNDLINHQNVEIENTNMNTHEHSVSEKSTINPSFRVTRSIDYSEYNKSKINLEYQKNFNNMHHSCISVAPDHWKSTPVVRMVLSKENKQQQTLCSSPNQPSPIFNLKLQNEKRLFKMSTENRDKQLMTSIACQTDVIGKSTSDKAIQTISFSPNPLSNRLSTDVIQWMERYVYGNPN